MLEIMAQDATKPAIPPLLAVGAVHHHLISNGLRMSASIVIDTAQCFSTHHFACLIGYGARYVTVRSVLVPLLHA
jgi:glutamate synthase (ferredoxin)